MSGASTSCLDGEGDRVKPGGGVAFRVSPFTPPPRYTGSPSPVEAWEERGTCHALHRRFSRSCSAAATPLRAQPAEPPVVAEARAFMADYARALMAGDRAGIAARYDRNGAYALGNGRKSFGPYARIVGAICQRRVAAAAPVRMARSLLRTDRQRRGRDRRPVRLDAARGGGAGRSIPTPLCSAGRTACCASGSRTSRPAPRRPLVLPHRDRLRGDCPFRPAGRSAIGAG